MANAPAPEGVEAPVQGSAARGRKGTSDAEVAQVAQVAGAGPVVERTTR
jgi:hypothetical protein